MLLTGCRQARACKLAHSDFPLADRVKPMLSSKISRRPLHDELAERLRTMIVEGQLIPGKRISEQALCTRFGVSRTPLREALKVLSAERLVRLLPNKGAVVVRITSKESQDLVAVLGILEAFAGELVCAVADDRTVAEIRSLQNRMVEHFRRDERRAYMELHHAIHDALIAATGNGVLIETYRMLKTRIRGVLSIVRDPPAGWNEAVEEHVRMMEALEARDGTTLARLARRHVRDRMASVDEALRLWNARPGCWKVPPRAKSEVSRASIKKGRQFLAAVPTA